MAVESAVAGDVALAAPACPVDMAGSSNIMTVLAKYQNITTKSINLLFNCC